jgi:membrane protease YdiL (CAAX protease family)
MPGLSISALMAFCPTFVALILRQREHGRGSVLGLLRRSDDFRRMPPVGSMGPARMFSVTLTSLAIFLAFLVAAFGEELGWSGYVLEPLQKRLNALQAGLISGVASVLAIYGPSTLSNARDQR